MVNCRLFGSPVRLKFSGYTPTTVLMMTQRKEAGVEMSEALNICNLH